MPRKRRSPLLLLGVFVLAACGTSTISKAPRVASLTACASTRAAATSAGNVAFATTGSYPTTFTELTAGKSPLLIPGDDTTVAATTITGAGWKLTMTGGGATPPTFACANTPAG